MDNFDPDAYLASKESPTTADAPSTSPDPAQNLPESPAQQFDPDAYLKSKEAPSFDPDVYLKQKDAEKYNNPEQALTAGIEGLGRGLTAGLSDVALSKTGVSQEDIKGRQNAYPNLSKATELAGMVAPAGALGLINKGLEAAKVGSGVIRGALQMGLYSGADETSKALMGDNNPENPVAYHLANVGANMVTGGLLGALGSKASQALKSAETSKWANKLDSYLTELGTADSPASNALKSKIGATAAGAITGKIASLTGAWAAAPLIFTGVNKIIKTPVSKAYQYVSPAVLKVLAAGDTPEVGNVVDYAKSIGRGAQITNDAIERLLKGSANKVIDDQVSAKEKEKLQGFIESGAQHDQISAPQQQYAEGGEVKAQTPILDASWDVVNKHFPNQGMLLGAAKTRIAGYLNSIRPQASVNKRPYDAHHDQTEQQRQYDKASELALKPLKILNHISDGSLDPQTLQHFSSLYPELHNQLSKKLTENIAKHQLTEQKPKHKVIQAMSLFLGNNLDSTLNQPNIAAAQAVFATQQAQQQPPAPGRNKKNTATLGKASQQYQTSDQARLSRQDK